MLSLNQDWDQKRVESESRLGLNDSFGVNEDWFHVRDTIAQLAQTTKHIQCLCPWDQVHDKTSTITIVLDSDSWPVSSSTYNTDSRFLCSEVTVFIYLSKYTWPNVIKCTIHITSVIWSNCTMQRPIVVWLTCRHIAKIRATINLGFEKNRLEQFQSDRLNYIFVLDRCTNCTW